MFKSIFLTTVFIVIGLIIHSTAATTTPPPACVLACVNAEPTPSDLGSVCGSEDAQRCLASKCGDSKQEAVDYFRSTCQSAGHEVAQAVESSDNPSSSATATGSVTTNTAGTGRSVASATATGVAEQAANGATRNRAIAGYLIMVIVAASFLTL